MVRRNDKATQIRVAWLEKSEVIYQTHSHTVSELNGTFSL